jgi:hypothetical protein
VRASASLLRRVLSEFTKVGAAKGCWKGPADSGTTTPLLHALLAQTYASLHTAPNLPPLPSLSLLGC